ncbi:hypothetical protein H2198_005284 [Neophaeococcomyces mojaviensis]|uniref:Uncharacterized protein n=1 Tax=Neophaeococcomyces mojaviensis TaxID=3383035 RepID=A0ACC3A636_9EURO|nr:hypothetical protein H2198_005284 [Knufia sp. JES_112]
MSVHLNSSTTVAVIGLGAQGLVAVKNMLEEGYNVTGFDRNDYIGGIWHYCAEQRISVLPSTVVNVSRERACFTDFPFPEGTDSYPTASQIDRYLNSYADHFNLRHHLRLSTMIQSVKRDDVKAKWVLQIQPTGGRQPAEPQEFDKLIVAVGPHSTPVIPNLEGKEDFKGQILHSIAFKDPSSFNAKRVMVVGIGNTAADTATALVSHASSVFLAHRHGAAVLPRILQNGTSLDHSASYRTFGIKDTLDVYTPALSRGFVDYWTLKIIESEWGPYDPQWRLTPIPNFVHQVPTVSDTLIPALRAGKIKSVAVPKRVLGLNTVELEDGTTEDVDAIVYCTGYHPNFSFLGTHDPTVLHTTAGPQPDLLASLEAKPSALYATPILYQNIFSLTHADSLAFVGLALISFPAFLTSDLASMAVAQLWSCSPRSPTLPPTSEMYVWFQNHLQWSNSIRASSLTGRFPHLTVQNGPWLTWVQKVVGTELDEHLSLFSLKAWRFWISDRRFCGLLMNKIYSPHFYRLFDSNGRRKSWSGARVAIETVNEDVRRRLKEKRKKAGVVEDKSPIMVKVMPVDVVVAA